MGIATGFVLYIVYWWIIFLICLPWGVQVDEASHVPGQASSAPSHPQLKKKVLITTLVSAVFLAVTAWGIEQKWVVLDMAT